MDNITPGQELNDEDATRQSLIEISYEVPDGDSDVPEKIDETRIQDGNEIYRTKLISISDSPSPDANVPPSSLPDHLNG